MVVISAVPLSGMALLVWFEDSTCKIYDVRTFGIDDESVHESVGVLDDGLGLVWNDKSILMAHQLLAHGTKIDIADGIVRKILLEIASSRAKANISQIDLSKAAGIHQPSISRLEKCTLNPRLDTAVKALAPLGKTLAIVPLEDADPSHEWRSRIERKQPSTPNDGE